MKLNHLFILASLVILGIACPFSAALTPTSTAIPTTSTLTPAILNTSQPPATATVASLLTTNGPYLAYLRNTGNGQELVLMDADGKGQAAFPFPINGNVYSPRSLSNLVSPDGIWLAFYSGSAGSYSHVGTDTADLTLNLISLFTGMAPVGSPRLVTRLLSTDYPANFAQAARELAPSDNTPQSLQDAFISGITQSIAWSPDGLYLAFAGQMDGLSSDLYLYNAADGTIQRLSSGPQQVQNIEWSPDGKWILNSSNYWMGEGAQYNLFATSPDGQVVRPLLENSLLAPVLTWINPHAFLTYQNQNGMGNYALELVDLESGNVDKVWDGSFNSLAVDTSGAWLALYTWESGLVLIDLATPKSTNVQVPDPAHVYAAMAVYGPGSEPERAFMVWDETDSSLYNLTTNGALTSAGTSADFFSVAPNQAYWIAIKDDNIQAFLGAGSQARNFRLPDGTTIGDFQEILWRPDSSGLFLASSAGQLYMLDFSSGLSRLVENYLSPTDPVAGVPAGLIWVHK